MKRWIVKYSLVLTLLAAVAWGLLGPPLEGVHADPPEPTPSPAPDIKTRLQAYQTPDVEPSWSDGRLLEEAPMPSEAGEPPVSALAQQTFYAISDALVLQGYPSLNFGSTVDMWAGYDEDLEPDGQIARSLVSFDIASLPTHVDITTATLRVYLVSSWDYPDTSRTITTYRITSGWSESTVTWDSSPGYGEAYGSNSIPEDEWDWYEFDVTNLVRAWYDGTYTNHGVMLRGPEVSGSDSSWRGFSTRESPDVPPQLVVEYTPWAAPRVDSITPDSGTNDGVVHITNLAGGNFQNGATVELTRTGEVDINATNAVVVSASQITCDFDLTGVVTGTWDVVVTNPDSQSGTLPGGFNVTTQGQSAYIYLPIVLKNYIPGRLYFDDFSDPNSGWDVGDTSDSAYGYDNGNYYIQLKQDNRLRWVWPGDFACADCTIEVEAWRSTGANSSYGIVFGLNSSGDQFYLFEVHPGNQMYWLVRRDGVGTWVTLIPGTGSAYINSYDSHNRLKVTREGSQIRLYVNGHYLTSYSDSTYTGIRYVGVLGASGPTSPVSLRYDNFTVWAIGYGTTSATGGDNGGVGTAPAPPD